MRSAVALAIGLALVHPSSARVANGPAAEISEVSTSTSGSAIVNWLGRLFRRKAQITCVQDEYYDFTAQTPFGEQFCQAFMGYPTITTTVGITPVTTTTNVYSTVIVTRQEVLHTTVVTTASAVTITPTPIAKRNAALDMNEIFQDFRRERAILNVTAIDTPQMSASFSSACDCQTYAGETVTATRTNSARVVTVSAFERDTTTVTSVQTDALITTTATVTAPTPTPTAPTFSCPSDNNSTVSQLVGNERFDYLVLCDTDLNDNDFYNVLSYSSFSECAAACSVADARFDSPVCQGFSYYSTNSAYNCFLKGTANNTVPVLGVDSAILQRIAVGLTDDAPAGTNTESAPFVGETQTSDPSQLSSSMSSFIANSSTSMPVITPGPAPVVVSGRPVIPGETLYSTYISDGSTYSSGTVFSSYFSANGSWYFTYYTAFTQSWASATTVYASSETGSAISNSSNTEISTQPGNNGEYYTITVTNTTSYFPGGYNVTEVTSNVTLAQNGTQIASSAVTSYYSIATGGSGGGSGGSGVGGIGSSGAGIITGAGVTSTSVFSTFTIFSNGGQGGGSNGGAGSGVLQTPAPSVSIVAGGTAFSSGFAASGVVSGVSGAASGAGSGVVSATRAPLSAISSTVVVGGTAFSLGFAASGGGGGAVSASSTAASGATLSSTTGAPFTPISSTNGVGATAFSSGFASSGVVSDTRSASSTALSGVASSTDIPSFSGPLVIPIFSTRSVAGTSGASSTAVSGGSPFTNSNNDRTGTLLSSSRTSSRSLALPTPIFSTRSFTGISGASSTATSGGSPFTNSNRDRSGTLSTSSPTSSLSVSLSSVSISTFAPTPSTGRITLTQSGPLSTGPVPYNYVPFTNSNGLRTFIPSGSSVPSGFVVASTLSSTAFSLSGTGVGSIVTVQTTLPSGIGESPSASSSLPRPSSALPSTGFAPSGSAPSGAASTGFAPSGLTPSGTRPLFSTGTAPTSFPISTGSSGVPFANSELPRTGSLGLSTGTSPASVTPPYPTGASRCVPSYLGTTTIFTTVTQYGCYSNCPPQGSPLTFGPPSAQTGGGGYY